MLLPNRRLDHFEAGLRIERRSEGEPEQLVGHAAVFNQWTVLYQGRSWRIRERLIPGCFKNALAEKQDVRALFNHDANYVLGRTRSGTLALEEDATGLLSRTDYPRTQTIQDLVIGPVGRRDISGMSFGFNTRPGGFRSTEYEAEDGFSNIDIELTDLDLFDISVVTYPAYDGTDVGLRSQHVLTPEFREAAEVSFEEVRKLLGVPAREPSRSADRDAIERATRARQRRLAMLG